MSRPRRSGASEHAGRLSALLERAGHPEAAAIATASRDRRGRCPLCDSSDGFSADDDRGVWNCFACQEGGGVRDLERLLGLEQSEWNGRPRPLTSRAPKSTDSGSTPGSRTRPPKRPKATARDIKTTWATASTGPVGDDVTGYALRRHFPEFLDRALGRVLTRDDQQRLPKSCGHLALGTRIVVPLFSADGQAAGKLVALQARAIDDAVEPRVVGAGPTKAAVFADRPGLEVLRGEADPEIVVLMVEGLTDFLAAACAGLPGVAVIGIAGAGNAEAAIGAWARRQTVLIAFDGDDSGRTATVEAAGRIHLWGGQPRLVPVNPDSDICEHVEGTTRDLVGSWGAILSTNEARRG